MNQFIVISTFILGGKTFPKDRILPASIPANTIKRLVSRGYVAPVKAIESGGEKPPPWAKGPLAPTQVNKLDKPMLIKYAAHLEVPNFSTKLEIAEMRSKVNDFIAKGSRGGGGA